MPAVRRREFITLLGSAAAAWPLAARAAQKFPWEPTRVSLYRIIVPQMTLRLPEEEGVQLRFKFEAEMARLEAA